MAIIPQALAPVSNIIDSIVPDRFQIRLQETLIRSGMYVKSADMITLAGMASIFLAIMVLGLAFFVGIDPIIPAILALFIPPLLMGGYIFIMMERRVDAIENSTPDFLRQIASLLRAGVGLETALEDVARHGGGPLNSELKRAVIEIKIGRTFDDAILSMGERLQSKNLDRTFRMILEGRRAGGSLSDVIETVAEDLRAVIALQRERKANVMMSVMFLIIAAIVAAPFALGMISVYSSFIASLGKTNALADAASIASGGYIIIHSIIAGLLIGVIMYGSARKGIKFAIPLAIAAYGIFYVVGKFAYLIVGV
ncbi:MAG: type II secretion system F family protein [Methanobacteriaceae archaeon]|nr:type II secretion system F family protein [Methanobacteriaceae archaeon]MDP2837111.1 type II secretion system F family protein [Methanobacteriaceae archaeon]MDP3485664.1 type II secretion system F family protein [Methanobacteriaceae archaeon]MDP3624068.1 type II secretion system F family protein [Methanobacteriaceae archaeon]